MESVSLEEVVRNWLRREQRKPYQTFSLEAAEHDWELVGTLLCECPFRAAFVWRYHTLWYRTELGREEFDRLRVVEGPSDESWRRLSPDGTIRGAAERIASEGLTGTYEDVDVDYIRRRSTTFEEANEEERLVVFQPVRSEPPYVVDGNHYATAKTLFLLDGGEFVPQPVYFGVRAHCDVGERSAPREQ